MVLVTVVLHNMRLCTWFVGDARSRCVTAHSLCSMLLHARKASTVHMQVGGLQAVMDGSGGTHMTAAPPTLLSVSSTACFFAALGSTLNPKVIVALEPII